MRAVRRASGGVVTRWLAAVRREVGRAVECRRRALVEDLVANSPVGLAFLDTGLRFRLLNEAFAAMTGASVEAHVGRTPMALAPGIDPRQYLPDLRAVLDGAPPATSLAITGGSDGSRGESARGPPRSTRFGPRTAASAASVSWPST